MGPLWREMLVSRAVCHTSQLSLKVPGKGAPLHIPQKGPCGESCSIFKANGLFIHLDLSGSPVKELSHEMGGKHTVTIHGIP